MTLRDRGEEVMGRDCDEKLGEIKRKGGPFIGPRNVRLAAESPLTTGLPRNATACGEAAAD
jgi:hypothetical protein